MESNSHPIIYRSAPSPVSMGDHWYELAQPDHFWIRRRFDVLNRLAGQWIRKAHSIGEIGCGNGLMQKSVEDHYGKVVAGFDLNEHALKQNLSRLSPCYCYDVNQRAEEFRAGFDVILLFDVLEHIEDESAFLQAVKFHLSRTGVLIVNVPAHQALYSMYDTAVGHYRRYNANKLNDVLTRNGITVRASTYWGAPLTPLLAVRKGMLAMRHNEANIVSSGFDPGPAVVNGALGLLARCEPIPQMWLGSSLMVVAEMTKNPAEG